MKNLYKKIGLGILVVALVLGVSLSKGAISYANSSSEKCPYESSSMRENLGFLEEHESEYSREILKEKESVYEYKVLAEYEGDVELKDRNSNLKRYYDSIHDFIDCMNYHKHEKGFYCCVIGQNSFIIEFK